MTRKRRSFLVWMMTALVAFGGPVAGQSVEGHLLADEHGSPLAGAYVTLVDVEGASVDETITDAFGAFRLDAGTPGPHVVRSEAPAHTVTETTLPLWSDTSGVELVAAPLALELPRAAVSPNRQCRLSANATNRVAALWTEVRKALRATTLAEDKGLQELERRTWIRRLDPDDLHTLDEDLRPVTAFLPGSPYRSPPAEELAQYGFIQGGEGEGYSFFAPDARTLLSPVFTQSHCLGFAAEGPEDAWVGLTFRPRFSGGMDVEGTLWIDAHTLGPQRLEYRYTALPWAVKSARVGGQIDFHRLDGGPWVVQRWWIRSPRVGVRNVRLTQWDAPRQQFGLSSVVEEGGEVLRVRFSDGSVEGLSQVPPESGLQPGPVRSGPGAR